CLVRPSVRIACISSRLAGGNLRPLQLVCDGCFEEAWEQSTLDLDSVDEEGRRAVHAKLPAEGRVRLHLFEHTRILRIEIRNLADLTRTLAQQLGRHGRLIVEEPVLERLGASLYACHANGRSGL